jgi:hypothetical protein
MWEIYTAIHSWNYGILKFPTKILTEPWLLLYIIIIRKVKGIASSDLPIVSMKPLDVETILAN